MLGTRGRGKEGRHLRADGVASVSDRGLVVGDGTVGDDSPAGADEPLGFEFGLSSSLPSKSRFVAIDCGTMLVT